MKKILLLSCLVLCVSCAPYYYIPNTLNMPLAGYAGEAKAKVYYGSGGLGLQCSYAIDSHLVIFQDFAYQNIYLTPLLNPDFGLNTNANTNNSYMGNLGIGTYSKINQGGRLEFLGGFGFGKTNATVIQESISIGFRPFSVSIDGSFTRVFVQADIGMQAEKAEIGFGLRISSIFMNGQYTVIIPDSRNLLLYNSDIHGTAVFAEPCVSLNMGRKTLKTNLSIGWSGQVSGMDITHNFGALYQPFFASVGLTLNILNDMPQQ